MPRLMLIGLAAGRHVAQALADHRLGEHGGRRRAVTGDVVGLLGDFLDELGPDLLVRVLQLDLLGDAHTIVGDGGRAPLLLEDDVAALGAERDLDRVGELVHPSLETAAGLLVESNQLRHSSCDSFGVIQRVAAGSLPATDGRAARRTLPAGASDLNSPVRCVVTLVPRVPTSCLALAPRECKRPDPPGSGRARLVRYQPGSLRSRTEPLVWLIAVVKMPARSEPLVAQKK